MLMMFRQARYLGVIAEQGSFTKAASKLRVSQPALSQQVQRLEDVLGVRLLDRSGGRVTATDAGKIYIHHVERALREMEAGQRAVQDIESLEAGSLRLAFLPLFTAYLIGPVVQAFNERYPRISISIEVMAQASIESALAEAKLDVAIGFGDPASDEVVAFPLRNESLCLIVEESHPLADRDDINAGELTGLDLALLNSAFVTRAPIDRYLRAHAAQPNIIVQSNSVDALISIVRGGRLATIMLEALAQNVVGLRAIRLNPPIAARTTSILERKDAYRSAATKAFVALLLDREW